MFPSPFARLFGMVSAPFATNNTVIKGTKLPKSGTVIRKLSFAPRSRAALSLSMATHFLRCRGTFFFGYSGAIFERSRSPFHCLVQNKHSTRSVYEASEAMLIFVIMGGQWMDGFFGEPSARAVNSPPPSCYKDSIEQVAPAMPRARHEPN